MSYIVCLSFSEVTKQISSWHELHDDVERIVVYTYTEHLDDVLVVEITMRERER